MAPPAKLAHLVWKTGQFAEMVEWYLTVLEAHEMFRNDFLAFITYDEEHHRVAFVNAGTTADDDQTRSGLEHVAFTYADLTDLLGTYERLAAIGIRPYWCINHGPTTSIYYEDPDHNHVELQIDNFTTLDALAEWFATGAFLANPIGVDFDPDVLLAKLRAGEPVDELIKQGSAPSPAASASASD